MIQTVLGPIRPDAFGFALPHEHVLCDFIGAAATGPHRWDADEVFRTMLPYLRQARDRGVTGFVDCTPAYIGRDVRLLQRLARETGLHILTNTGYYGAAKDKYLPTHALTETSDALAARWIREWEKGIDGTDVRPGFLKIGVDPAEGTPPRLSEVDARIVRAAARASKRTGLSVASHTGQGAAALAQLAIFAEEGVPASRFIYVHADGEKDADARRQVAVKGAWVEFDAVGSRPADEHLKQVLPLVDAYPDRVLLSMDRGWYNAGEPNGGKIRDYNALHDAFLPSLRAAGVREATIRKLTVENPAKAFTKG